MPYIGEIRMFAGNFPPVGWEFCEGQALPISENDALFVLIGTTYGGDGESTFNLPDLRGRIPLHHGTGPSGTSYVIGEKAGVETVTLTVQQIPVHNHSMVVSGDAASSANPANQVLGASPRIRPYIQAAPDGNLNAASIAPVGGSQPHTNLQPSLCVNFIISLFGVFPAQT